MKITERAQLAGLMIVQAHELTDVRQIGHALHEAEILLEGLQTDIDNLRDSYAGKADEIHAAMYYQTKDKLTVAEEDDQNKRLASAHKRSKQHGLPSGIRNY